MLSFWPTYFLWFINVHVRLCNLAIHLILIWLDLMLLMDHVLDARLKELMCQNKFIQQLIINLYCSLFSPCIHYFWHRHIHKHVSQFLNWGAEPFSLSCCSQVAKNIEMITGCHGNHTVSYDACEQWWKTRQRQLAWGMWAVSSAELGELSGILSKNELIKVQHKTWNWQEYVNDSCE